MRAPILLDVQQIYLAFGGLLALNGATLQLYQGEILGLVGPNGSGKTTLLNVISGQLRPTSGQLFLEQRAIQGLPPHQLAQLGIARTYQIPRPFRSATVLDNVALGLMFGRQAHSHAAAIRQSEAILDFVGLRAKAHALAGQLNLHERKFLELARALAVQPKVLLLDEVLAGLNPTEIELGIDLLRRIRERGITLLFVEHNLRAVLALCDRLVVLNYGQPIATGVPTNVMNDPQVIAAYLGDERSAAHHVTS